MPRFFQVLSFFNPLRHYVTVARSLILKGVGLGMLWPEGLILMVFAAIFLTVSIRQFPAQLH